MNTITNADFFVLNWINEHFSCNFLDFLMPKVTFLGNNGLIWIITAIIMIFIKKTRKTGIKIGAGLFSSVILGNLILKNLIARERPCWINNDISMLIPMPQDYSFPSGHTFSSFAAATIIMCFNKKMGIAAYIVAAMIAFSRLYLYVHFPTDVLAGAVLGILVGISCNHILNMIFKHINA